MRDLGPLGPLVLVFLLAFQNIANSVKKDYMAMFVAHGIHCRAYMLNKMDLAPRL